MKPDTPIVAIGEILWDLLPTGPRAGGAPFNFAFHCHQLGHKAIMVSRVGDDDLGRELRDEVRRLGMSDEYIQTDPEHPTGTVKVELNAAGQPTYTIIDEAAWDYIALDDHLRGLAEACQVICFGTLAMRSFPSRWAIERFRSLVHERALIVCDVNLRPPFAAETIIRSAALLAHWLKLNAEEVHRVLASLSDPKDRVPVTRPHGEPQIDPSALGIPAYLVCVTRGANGCQIRTTGELIDLPGIPISVADTVGAGDAFTAALLTQHLEGKPLAEAARFANAYAAVVVSKPGGTPSVTRAEVERLL